MGANPRASATRSARPIRGDVLVDCFIDAVRLHAGLRKWGAGLTGFYLLGCLRSAVINN